MPKGAMLINTARKEVINEEELVQIMDERPDFRYVSDITPDNASVFAENLQDAISSLRRKWVLKQPKPTSTQESPQQNNR